MSKWIDHQRQWVKFQTEQHTSTIQPKARAIGTSVAYREGFTNIVRRGTVVSVKVIANGYPITRVDFPGWKGEIEFAAESLADGDQFDTVVNWWAS